MGTISTINTDNLYWLGRYTERVYTTIRLFAKSFDGMIENAQGYMTLCTQLEIPNIYKDAEDFVHRYCYDSTNVDSIYANLIRAYDNAIILREELGSETLAYIQLAVYEMNNALDSSAPMIGLMKVMDYILAFWGIADDSIADEGIRSLIKAGKRIERLDLYARLHQPMEDIQREFHRLESRLLKTDLKYDNEKLDVLRALVRGKKLAYSTMLELVEGLVF